MSNIKYARFYFNTSRDRTSYTVRNTYGKRIAQVKVDNKSFTKEMLESIHQMDMLGDNVNMKEEYHVSYHYDALDKDERYFNHTPDWDFRFADNSTNPEAVFLSKITLISRV